MCDAACHSPNAAPAGSTSTAIEPISLTAIGATIVVAPASIAAAAVAWMSWVAR